VPAAIDLPTLELWESRPGEVGTVCATRRVVSQTLSSQRRSETHSGAFETLRVAPVSLANAARRARDTPLRPAPPLLSGNTRATLTLMTGPDAGLVVSVDGETTIIGRDPTVDLSFDDAALSRKHARLARGKHGEYLIEDLGSTNGTYVSARRIRSSTLCSGDHIQLGPSLLLRFELYDAEDESLQRKLFESAVRDPLTGAFNRQHLSARLASETAHARRIEGHIAVLMLDIDHFKQFNDDCGHLAGDRVLRVVANQIERIIRTEDLFARYGGDEFVVLVRDAELDEATRLAQRLRDAVRLTLVRHKTMDLSVTVSIGVAALDELPPTAGPTDLLAAADARLYGAKLAGRDRVCSAG
jgi:two-component system cell cycle response regulator